MCSQIKKREGRDLLVTYFVPDDIGGYQKEGKSYFIDSVEIMKSISKPEIKKVGR